VIRIFLWCDLLPDTTETLVPGRPRAAAMIPVTAIFAFPPVGAARTEHPIDFLQELYPDGKESVLPPADTSTEMIAPSPEALTDPEISAFNLTSHPLNQ